MKHPPLQVIIKYHKDVPPRTKPHIHHKAGTCPDQKNVIHRDLFLRFRTRRFQCDKCHRRPPANKNITERPEKRRFLIGLSFSYPLEMMENHRKTIGK